MLQLTVRTCLGAATVPSWGLDLIVTGYNEQKTGTRYAVTMVNMIVFDFRKNKQSCLSGGRSKIIHIPH